MSASKNRVLLSVLALGAMTALFANCSKTDDVATDTVDPTFSSIYSKVIAGTGCVQCHQPGGIATDQRGVQLNFSTQALAYSTLTSKNVTGLTSSGTCGTVKIVNAGNPALSFLMGSLFSDYAATSGFAGVAACATYPHTADTHVSSAGKTALIGWIQSGAQNN